HTRSKRDWSSDVCSSDLRAWRISKDLAQPEEPLLTKKRRKKPRPRLPSRADWKYGKESRRLKNTGLFILVLALSMAVLALSHPAQGTLALHLGCAVAGSAALLGGLRQVCINHIHKAPELRPNRLTHRKKAVDEQQKHPGGVSRRPAHKKNDEGEGRACSRS